MDSFVKFLVSQAGRIARVVLGIIIVAVGFFVIQDITTGVIVMLIGLIPLAGGLFDFCLLGPLFGKPISGKKIRAGS